MAKKKKKKINSRDKGKRGEYQVRDMIKDRGFHAERGQQRSGSPDSPDVKHDMGPVHIEVKWVERLNIYQAMAQCLGDKGEDEIGVVFHRKNSEEWHVTMKAEDFFDLWELKVLADL
jgi:Holliday junction resolvase